MSGRVMNRRSLIRLVAVASAALVALAACGTSAESSTTSTSSSISRRGSPTFAGADGVTSDVADTSRIVSLSGDITEFIFALGRGSSVVGIDITTVFPEEAAALPIVGLGRFMTAEGILAHNPTLVIGDTQSATANRHRADPQSRSSSHHPPYCHHVSRRCTPRSPAWEPS